MRGGVVGTQMSNLGLAQALARLQVPFARARVGDRYVLEMLHQRGWQLGGENSGHIICLDKHTTGDGIISALQVLRALRRWMTLLRPLVRRLYHQVLVNVRVRAVNLARCRGARAVNEASGNGVSAGYVACIRDGTLLRGRLREGAGIGQAPRRFDRRCCVQGGGWPARVTRALRSGQFNAISIENQRTWAGARRPCALTLGRRSLYNRAAFFGRASDAGQAGSWQLEDER